MLGGSGIGKTAPCRPTERTGIAYSSAMPITEIVRVLARGRNATSEVEMFYDVDGRMGPDEGACGRPHFWLKLRGATGESVLGPYDDEPDALRAGEALGFTWA